MPETLAAEKSVWKALEPYAQLVTALLPRAAGLSVFDAEGWMRWSTEATMGPDLPNALLPAQERALAQPDSPGQVLEIDGDEFPYYLWWLRDDAGRFIASVAVSTRKKAEGEAATFAFVHALVKPAMECLRRELAAQSSILNLHQSLSVRDKDVELLLSVTDHKPGEGGDHVDELKMLLQNAADHLASSLAALIVPEKSIAMMRAGKGQQVNGSLLARTHRQLLQIAQTRREAVMINRVSGNGESLPYRILCCPVKHASGRVTGVFALFREDTAEEFAERDARLVELLARRVSTNIESSYDSLSGLLTRTTLEQRARAALAEPGRHAGWSVLYIDCDQLHLINENFGMHVGDGVLAQLGELIRNRLPPGGLGARISGDRFALVVPLRREAAGEFSEALRIGAEQLGNLQPSARLQVSISIGVAEVERDAEQIVHALAAAESACKAGKDRGRNRVETYEEADISIIRRFTDITTAGDLRDALANNRMRLDAQLIQPIGPHAGVPHYELLLRMITHKGEKIGPDRFLSAAQRYQMMPAVDRWVVESAISALEPCAEWLAERTVMFSINFSGQSLNDDDFADFLLKRLTDSPLDPALFCFELTESDAVANIAKAETLMRRLRRLGCSVALDDFGTGLSSLAYLRSLPVTQLKIDGSFVRDILKDPRSDSMVQAIAQLARTMGIATVAEYVETVEIRNRIVTLGVDYAQGFAIGRPQPLTDMLMELPLLISGAGTGRVQVLAAAAAAAATREAAGGADPDSADELPAAPMAANG